MFVNDKQKERDDLKLDFYARYLHREIFYLIVLFKIHHYVLLFAVE